MSSRRFNLQAVLDLRARAKEAAQERLSVAHENLRRAREERERADAELASLAERIGGATFTAANRQNGWALFCDHDALCRQLQGRQTAAEALVRTRMDELVKARCDHELVLRLREKWQRTQAQELARREERILEEFATFSRHLQRA